MTEEEMENIANLVVQKLVKLQQNGEIYLGLAQEEVLFAEIARLTTLLSMYEAREQYEAASIIHNKIKNLESKLRKI